MKAFTGAAGTGKTTRLMLEVDAWLAETTLGDDEYVLALTRMHGSRRRLIERLRSSSARKRFRCMTIDRFAWTVASRWRSLTGESDAMPQAAPDYDATAAAAARILNLSVAAAWVRARYPLIVVDELQDCRGGQLALVQALERSGELFVAADPFQDLEDGTAPAAAWMLGVGQAEELLQNHRTEQEGLLAAARAVRNSETVSQGKGFRVLQARNADVGAKFLANQIRWSAGKQLVVLSPAGPEGSSFVKKVLHRLQEKPFTDDGKSFGPYCIPWQGPLKSRTQDLLAALALPEDSDVAVDLSTLPTVDSPEGAAFRESAERLIRCGRQTISAGDVRAAVGRSVQRARAWASAPRGIWGTTIHGAKNREFEYVAILWPYEAPRGDAGARSLYNAVTRAKQGAVVIVQDPKGARTAAAPFVAAKSTASEPEKLTQVQLDLFGNAAKT